MGRRCLLAVLSVALVGSLALRSFVEPFTIISFASIMRRSSAAVEAMAHAQDYIALLENDLNTTWRVHLGDLEDPPRESPHQEADQRRVGYRWTHPANASGREHVGPAVVPAAAPARGEPAEAPPPTTRRPRATSAGGSAAGANHTVVSSNFAKKSTDGEGCVLYYTQYEAQS